ncbi:MAG TPA: hypothetical protein DCM40_18125 [Maribacter sp.]|nr:hypothetical protein [Maribacter sp.]
MTDKRYIIIGRSSCPFCRMAADICVAKKINYIFLDYIDDVSILEDYKSFHNHKTVPIVLENNLDTGLTRKVGGYQDLLEYLNC